MPQEVKRGSFRGDVRSRDYTTGPDAHIQNRNSDAVQRGLKKAAQHRQAIATKGVTPGLPPGGTVNSTMSVPPPTNRPMGMALPPEAPPIDPGGMTMPPSGGMVPPPSGGFGGFGMPMPRSPMGGLNRPQLGGPPPMTPPPPDVSNQMGPGVGVSPLFGQYLQQLMQAKQSQARPPMMGRRTPGY